MITADPSSTAMFRQATANSIPFVHVRKLCGCGRQVTARQLSQHGKCPVCVGDEKVAA
jgi:hypothetical protein